MSNDKSNKSKSEDQLMLDRLNDNKSNVGDSIGISSHERSVTDTESANEDNRFEIMPAADYIKRLKQGDCMSDEYIDEGMEAEADSGAQDVSNDTQEVAEDVFVDSSGNELGQSDYEALIAIKPELADQYNIKSTQGDEVVESADGEVVEEITLDSVANSVRGSLMNSTADATPEQITQLAEAGGLTEAVAKAYASSLKVEAEINTNIYFKSLEVDRAEFNTSLNTAREKLKSGEFTDLVDHLSAQNDNESIIKFLMEAVISKFGEPKVEVKSKSRYVPSPQRVKSGKYDVNGVFKDKNEYWQVTGTERYNNDLAYQAAIDEKQRRSIDNSHL